MPPSVSFQERFKPIAMQLRSSEAKILGVEKLWEPWTKVIRNAKNPKKAPMGLEHLHRGSRCHHLKNGGSFISFWMMIKILQKEWWFGNQPIKNGGWSSRVHLYQYHQTLANVGSSISCMEHPGSKYIQTSRSNGICISKNICSDHHILGNKKNSQCPQKEASWLGGVFKDFLNKGSCSGVLTVGTFCWLKA